MAETQTYIYTAWLWKMMKLKQSKWNERKNTLTQITSKNKWKIMNSKDTREGEYNTNSTTYTYSTALYLSLHTI